MAFSSGKSADLGFSSLTFLLPHAEEENHGAEDVDKGDDARGNHVSCSLWRQKKRGTRSGWAKRNFVSLILLNFVGSLSRAAPHGVLLPLAHRVLEGDDRLRVVEGGRCIAQLRCLLSRTGQAGGVGHPHDLALDSCAEDGAQELHRHPWEQEEEDDETVGGLLQTAAIKIL